MVKNQKKQPNKFLILISIGLEMGITIYLFIKLGKWLDTKYPQDFKLYSMLGTIFGVAISLYLVNKKLQKLNP